MKIYIDDEIKKITPQFHVGVLECNVRIYKESEIEKTIRIIEKDIEKNIDIKDVINLKTIIDGRNAYKKYGKDPSRYRLAVESLYRRLSKGKKLYLINNVVDLGNIVSLKSRRSVAVLDYHKIVNDIHIRLGKNEDDFYGIRRGKINITNIPLYSDDIGPFGSTTSDTLRTMISENTEKILLFIISFNGFVNLEDELEDAIRLYKQYADGTDFKTYIL